MDLGIEPINGSWSQPTEYSGYTAVYGWAGELLSGGLDSDLGLYGLPTQRVVCRRAGPVT